MRKCGYTNTCRCAGVSVWTRVCEQERKECRKWLNSNLVDSEFSSFQDDCWSCEREFDDESTKQDRKPKQSLF